MNLPFGVKSKYKGACFKELGRDEIINPSNKEYD